MYVCLYIICLYISIYIYTHIRQVRRTSTTSCAAIASTTPFGKLYRLYQSHRFFAFQFLRHGLRPSRETQTHGVTLASHGESQVVMIKRFVMPPDSDRIAKLVCEDGPALSPMASEPSQLVFMKTSLQLDISLASINRKQAAFVKSSLLAT